MYSMESAVVSELALEREAFSAEGAEGMLVTTVAICPMLTSSTVVAVAAVLEPLAIAATICGANTRGCACPSAIFGAMFLNFVGNGNFDGSFLDLILFGFFGSNSLQLLHRGLRSPCSQMPGAPQSLQYSFSRPCSQTPGPVRTTSPDSQLLHLRPFHNFNRPWTHSSCPPHASQRAFCRPCSHMPGPPHSTQRPFRRPCGHMPDPPHSRQCFFSRLWTQMPDPPHSLQRLFCRLCSQMPVPPQLTQVARTLPFAMHLSQFGILLGILFGSAKANLPCMSRTNAFVFPWSWGRGCCWSRCGW